jgi:hypothetical protein
MMLLHLVFVGYVCSKKFLPPFPSQFHARVCFITIFIVYFLVISCQISLVRIPDDGKVQKNPVILCVIHHRQNPSESTK